MADHEGAKGGGEESPEVPLLAGLYDASAYPTVTLESVATEDIQTWAPLRGGQDPEQERWFHGWLRDPRTGAMYKFRMTRRDTPPGSR